MSQIPFFLGTLLLEDKHRKKFLPLCENKVLKRVFIVTWMYSLRGILTGMKKYKENTVSFNQNFNY